jgi:hypothetical protein
MHIRQKGLSGILLLTIGMFGAWSDVGYGCDYCMLSQGLSPLQTSTGVGVRLDVRSTVLDDLYDGSSKVDNPGNKETYLTTQLTGFYAINPELTALLVVPYSKKTMREIEDATGDVVTGDSTGLGDLSLFGRYIFLTRHALDSTTLLAGQLGIKFATGATDAKNDAGEFMDAHIQPGTGSTDVLLGLNGSHAVGRSTLSSSILYTFSGEGEAGDTTHQFGDMLNYDVTGLYRIYPATPPGPTVSVAVGIAGEQRGDETIDGANVGGSGHVVYLNTGLLYIPAPKWVLEFNYRPAIYHNVALITEEGAPGPMLGEKYKMVLSATHTF